jgi:hypothetical protein
LALTLILQFQIAVRTNSEDQGFERSLLERLIIAIKVFEQITTANGFLPQMLYYCAIDAHMQDKKHLGFRVLGKILKQYDDIDEEAKSEIRLPVLLRYVFSFFTVDQSCVIRFAFAELDQSNPDPDIVAVLCGHFEAGYYFGAYILTIAAREAEQTRGQKRSQFTLKELDWFSKNAYNYAVNGCENWGKKHIISVTESCIKVFPWCV